MGVSEHNVCMKIVQDVTFFNQEPRTKNQEQLLRFSAQSFLYTLPLLPYVFVTIIYPTYLYI